MESCRLYEYAADDVVTERIVWEVPAAMPAASSAMSDGRTRLPVLPRRSNAVELTEHASIGTRRIVVRGNVTLDSEHYRELSVKKLRLSIRCTRCGQYNMIGTHFCDSCWLFQKDTTRRRVRSGSTTCRRSMPLWDSSGVWRLGAWNRDSCTSRSSPSSIIAGREKWGTGASSTVTRMT